MANKKIKIGLSYTDWRYEEYVNWLLSSDESVEVVRLSYETDNYADLYGCDALVLSGGKDVNPEIYGKADQKHKCGKLLPVRDEFEQKLIEIALEKSLPILGICRGLQIFNVSRNFKGTLHCDIPSIGDKEYLVHSVKAHEGIRHPIKIKEGTLLEEIMRTNEIEVNSFHHQSVDLPGNDLIVSSTAPDGIVESLEWNDRKGKPFLILLQWHAERLVNEESSIKLLKYFYNSIKQRN